MGYAITKFRILKFKLQALQSHGVTYSRAPMSDARLPRVSKTICKRSRRSSLYSAVVQEMVNYLHYFTNNVKNYVYHDLHIYSR